MQSIVLIGNEPALVYDTKADSYVSNKLYENKFYGRYILSYFLLYDEENDSMRYWDTIWVKYLKKIIKIDLFNRNLLFFV